MNRSADDQASLFDPPASLRAEFTPEGFARHHMHQQRQHLVGLVILLILAISPWVWFALDSITPKTMSSSPSTAATEPSTITGKVTDDSKGSDIPLQSRHLHATLELIGALFGMFTGFALVLRFYALGNRYHLLIGLAFFVTGVQDFIYGIFFFPALFREAEPFAKELIPLTFAAGRFLMGVTLILALLLPGWMSAARNPRWETIRGSLIVLLIVFIAAALLRLPGSPPLFDAPRALQPIDFIALVVLVTAFVGYLARYYRGGEMLDLWITASLAVNVVGQLLMLISSRSFDTLFLASHFYKVAGYMIPLIGFLLYQIVVVLEYERSRRDLIEAREAALLAASAKAEFLANMSHEIRTPMNGVLGMTERALRTSLTQTQREYLTAVRDSAQSLLNLLNDVLDFSKIEAGKFHIDHTDFSLRQTVETSIRPLRPSAQDKGLDLDVDIDTEVPDWFRGDPRRLRQVLVNLVGNAIKFTPTGSIRLAIHFGEPGIHHGHHATRVHFSVKDTGIGIPREKQEVIFDAFSQADGSTTRRFGGTGLGLAISSELVSMMGGRINVESEVGKGSTFRFWIWLEPRDHAPIASDSSFEFTVPELRSHHPSRILLAEDNEINQRLAVEMLREMGHDVVLAKTGREVLHRVADDDEPIDLILMDLQMPEMGGVEATQLLRQSDRPDVRKIPVIAVTAHAMPDDRARCLEAGMDEYLSKPIDEHELFRVIEESLGKRPVAALPLPAPTAQAIEAMASSQLFDEERLLAQVRGDRELLSELVDLFRQQWESLSVGLRDAFDHQDSVTLAALAHKLSGAVGNFQAMPVVNAVRELERNAKETDWIAASESLDQIEKMLSTLLGQLSTLAFPNPHPVHPTD